MQKITNYRSGETLYVSETIRIRCISWDGGAIVACWSCRGLVVERCAVKAVMELYFDEEYRFALRQKEPAQWEWLDAVTTSVDGVRKDDSRLSYEALRWMTEEETELFEELRQTH